MQTLIAPTDIIASPIVLRGITWEVYVSLREQLDEAGQKMYLTFDRGTLEIMPPSPFHERHKKLLARIIETLALELHIPIACMGSSTIRREELARAWNPMSVTTFKTNR